MNCGRLAFLLFVSIVTNGEPVKSESDIELSNLTNPMLKSEEYHIQRRLFTHFQYNRNVRPVINNSKPTKVEICLVIHQLKRLVNRENLLEMSTWFRFEWTDEFLRWDQSEFNNVSSISVTAEKIWRPDIALYNSLSSRADYDVISLHSRAIVYHNGVVQVVTPRNLVAACVFNVRLFPYDRQQCSLTFGSFAHSTDYIYLTIADSCSKNGSCGADIDYFEKNNEFELVEAPAQIEHKTYVVGNWTDAIFTLHIRRRPTYHFYHVVLPSVLLVFIAISSFFLPPESGERVSLSITLVLAMVLFLQLVGRELPPSAEMPLLGQFFGASVVMLSLSTILGVFIIRMHHSGNFGVRLPKYLRHFLLCKLARLFRMHHLKTASADEEESAASMKKRCESLLPSSIRKNTTHSLTGLTDDLPHSSKDDEGKFVFEEGWSEPHSDPPLYSDTKQGFAEVGAELYPLTRGDRGGVGGVRDVTVEPKAAWYNSLERSEMKQPNGYAHMNGGIPPAYCANNVDFTAVDMSGAAAGAKQNLLNRCGSLASESTCLHNKEGRYKTRSIRSSASETTLREESSEEVEDNSLSFTLVDTMQRLEKNVAWVRHSVEDQATRQSETDAIKEEWITAAIILDRCLLYFYVIVGVILFASAVAHEMQQYAFEEPTIGGHS